VLGVPYRSNYDFFSGEIFVTKICIPSEQVTLRLGPSAGRRLAASSFAPPFIYQGRLTRLRSKTIRRGEFSRGTLLRARP